MKPAFFILAILIALCSNAISANTDTSSQQIFDLSTEGFIAQAFSGEAPDPQRIWIRNELKVQVEAILQHPPNFLRTKYWLKDDLSVWIIDEIGKVKPITSGIIISHKDGASKIVDIKVLAFRESRGWEVKHRFFTDQFQGMQRSQGHGLSASIDGITGATLSVRALKKVAEIALLLDEHVRAQP